MARAHDRDQTGPEANFAVARHGYDRTQVRQCVRQLEETARTAHRQRDEARDEAAELGGRLELATREIAALNERLDQIEGGDSTLGAQQRAARVVEVAKSQATELTERARLAAEHTWATAEKSSAALHEHSRRALAELERQQTELRSAHESIMKAARVQARELTEEADRRRTRLDRDAEQDRVRIDREFSESIKAQRAAVEQELEGLRRSAEFTAGQLVSAARDEANGMISATKREVAKLTELRDQLVHRLRETQHALDQAAELLAAEADEGQVLAGPWPAEEDTDAEPVPPQRARSNRDEPAIS